MADGVIDEKRTKEGLIGALSGVLEHFGVKKQGNSVGQPEEAMTPEQQKKILTIVEPFIMGAADAIENSQPLPEPDKGSDNEPNKGPDKGPEGIAKRLNNKLYHNVFLPLYSTIRKISEAVMDAIKAAGNSIKNVATTVKNAISAQVVKISQAIKDGWKKLKTEILNQYGKVKAIGTKLKDNFVEIRDQVQVDAAKYEDNKVKKQAKKFENKIQSSGLRVQKSFDRQNSHKFSKQNSRSGGGFGK
ncbi:hypothetical protein [Rickettsia endosymbiont of Cardiosporidium cionae]|uniref:hypothetical protein n=1 Tax=Rickettsia endosymbiont of Cardiosporidium cionae TaxID=2777155 RepID=UPI00189511DB|nr:hypothetical protein [Rickettsia endosymbiont of Cardiosporidium cionae]KAF8818551.1 hypothetical protein IHI24_000267 [Rickettsia endosymbiont of Cardiosporidium cionae]